MMEKQQVISQAIRQQFVQQVDFLQQLVQARSVNPFVHPDKNIVFSG